MLKAIQITAAAGMAAALVSTGLVGAFYEAEALERAASDEAALRRTFCPVLDRTAERVREAIAELGASISLPYKSGPDGGKGFLRETEGIGAPVRKADAALAKRIGAIGRSGFGRALRAAGDLLLSRTAETIAAVLLLMPLIGALVLDGIWQRRQALCEERRPGRIRLSLSVSGMVLGAFVAPILMMLPGGWGIGMSAGAPVVLGLLLRTWLANTQRWD